VYEHSAVKLRDFDLRADLGGPSEVRKRLFQRLFPIGEALHQWIRAQPPIDAPARKLLLQLEAHGSAGRECAYVVESIAHLYVFVEPALVDEPPAAFKAKALDAVEHALTIVERDLDWRFEPLAARVHQLRGTDPVCHVPLPRLSKRARSGWSIEFWLDVTEARTDVTALLKDPDGNVSATEVVAHLDCVGSLEDLFPAKKVAFTASGVEVSDKAGRLLATIAAPGARLH
jgi:hypothetical protein